MNAISVPESAVGKDWAVKRLLPGEELPGMPREAALLETDGAAYLSPKAARWLAMLLLAYADAGD